MDGVLTSSKSSASHSDALTLKQQRLDVEVTKLEHITKQLNILRASSLSDPRIKPLEDDMNRQVSVVENLVISLQRRATEDTDLPTQQTSIQVSKRRTEDVKHSPNTPTKPRALKANAPIMVQKKNLVKTYHKNNPIMSVSPMDGIVVSAGAIRFLPTKKQDTLVVDNPVATTPPILSQSPSSSSPFRVFTVNVDDTELANDIPAIDEPHLPTSFGCATAKTVHKQLMTPRESNETTTFLTDISSYQMKLECILGKLCMLGRRNPTHASFHQEVTGMLCNELDRVDHMLLTITSKEDEMCEIQQQAKNYLDKLEDISHTAQQLGQSQCEGPIALTLLEMIDREKARAAKIKEGLLR